MDLGYKGYEFLTIANFVVLLLLPCLLDVNLLSLSVSSAVDLLPACVRFSNMNNPAVYFLCVSNVGLCCSFIPY